MTDPVRRFASTLIAIVVLLVATSPSVRGSEDANESLGTELLDDLDPSLFGTPEDALADPPLERPVAQPGFDKRILPGVIDDAAGEDIGRPSANNPLVQVERTMRQAADFINNDALPAAGDQQRQAVAELDKLIEQLSKQCCGGACQPGDQSTPASQRSQTSQARLGSNPGKGNAPARESVSQLREADLESGNSQENDVANREQLQKQVWGHLPAHVREQMLESYTDEFLPEYELEIEKYFRRLAEERDRDHDN